MPAPPDDPLAALGLPRGASAAELRRAYRAQARRLHPDAGGSTAAMARLNAAYEALARAPEAGPAAARVHRAPRRSPAPARPAEAWSEAAEAFAAQALRPQTRLLGIALDRLEIALRARLLAPRDAGRAAEARDVAGQAAMALTMAGSRLARAPWPEDLARCRALVGDALRRLSDALAELDDPADGPAAEAVDAALQGLAAGRAALAEAAWAAPRVG